MPNMLSVSTLQLGDPVIQFILVKPGDSLLHAAGLAESGKRRGLIGSTAISDE